MIDPFPDVVRIEPAGRCNYRCTHCPIGREGGKRRVLPFVDYVRFLNKLPRVPRVLVLYHGGEPLINPEIENMAHLAHARGVEKIAMNTNASLIKDRDLSGIDELRVSFDGESPEENDAIRVRSHFNEYANDVLRLANSPRRPKRIKIYNATRTGEGAQYLRDYFAGVPNLTIEGVKLREWARTRNTPHETNGVTYCRDLMDAFTILADGTVPMCCEDLQGDDIQGNVFQNTPMEIWTKMQAVRDAFRNRNYPRLCQTCWVTRSDK